jgi:hypothetical protein
MASELRVDTLKDAAGNNSVGMAYVAGGSAKAWMQYTTIGTTAAQDSLNVASVTDNGSGSTFANWSSVFVNNDYAVTTSCERSSFYHAMLHGIADTATNRTNLTAATAVNSAEDIEEGHCICMGDLA